MGIAPSRRSNENMGMTSSDASSKTVSDVVWRQPDGKRVTCTEKIKVLNENLEEIRDMCQDALEDAVLMGCDEAQVRAVLQTMLESLTNPYRKDPDGL